MTRMSGSRAVSAATRAGGMALLVILPQLVLGQGTPGTRQLFTLFALMVGLFTFSEYVARAPSLVEFRDARPYNRLRASALLVAVAMSCVMLAEQDPGTLAEALHERAEAWAVAMDVPFSPVRLVMATLPPEVSPHIASEVRAAATVSYLASLLMVAAFVLVVRWGNWPGRRGFNVWINLPQFDPTAGGDVVDRLQRDAVINLALGASLPLLAPLAVDLLSIPFDGTRLRDPSVLVWMVVAWSFVPANLVMRGIALNRLAWLIAAHRARRRRAEGAAQPA